MSFRVYKGFILRKERSTKTVKFLKCSICGNIVGLIQDGGGELVCCGKPMQELVANTEDAAQEKHVPVITVDGSTVRVAVGSVKHPMIEKHYIQWIYLQTTHGGQRYILKPGDKPEAVFALAEGAAPLAAYAYCNLHGLWTAKL